MELSAVRAAQKTTEEEEETFGRLVVPCSTKICAVQKYIMYPLQGVVEFGAATVGIEQSKDVYTDNWVETGPIMIKISLTRANV